MNNDITHSESDKNLRREEQVRRARKKYAVRQKKTHKRVFGTMTNEQYAQFEQRAKLAHRAVWSQIHAEAEAYASGEYLPSKDINERIAKLIVQLRRIGNNLNQIARVLNTDAEFDQPEFVQNLEDMETLIHAFVKMPWGKPTNTDDDEPSTS